jgi:hypothetical protein
LSERNGKQVPEKVGMKGVTRDGMDYEFTLVFDVDIKHNAVASKVRTGLFMDKPELKITSAIGEQILAWCQQGTKEPERDEFAEKIQACNSYPELMKLYLSNPERQKAYMPLFAKRKMEVAPKAALTDLENLKKSTNGNGSIQ